MLAFILSEGSTQKQFLALTCRFAYSLAAAGMLPSLPLFDSFRSFFSVLRQQQQQQRSNAWHSTANAFQRKVFKQIFAQLAGEAGRLNGGRGGGAWQLHGSFFLFFAPAFKQCAARRTVQGWSPGTPLLACHKMSNGAPCGMQQCFFLRSVSVSLSVSMSVCGCARLSYLRPEAAAAAPRQTNGTKMYLQLYIVKLLHSLPFPPSPWHLARACWRW